MRFGEIFRNEISQEALDDLRRQFPGTIELVRNASSAAMKPTLEQKYQRMAMSAQYRGNRFSVPPFGSVLSNETFRTSSRDI